MKVVLGHFTAWGSLSNMRLPFYFHMLHSDLLIRQARSVCLPACLPVCLLSRQFFLFFLHEVYEPLISSVLPKKDVFALACLNFSQIAGGTLSVSSVFKDVENSLDWKIEAS